MTQKGYTYITGMANKEAIFKFAKHRETSGKKRWLCYVLIPEIADNPELLYALDKHFKDYKKN